MEVLFISMSNKEPNKSQQFNGSYYLEDNGIFLGTKQNQPINRSVKPPRIVSKSFNSSTPLHYLPRCVTGFEYFGAFPSPLYDPRSEQTYLNQCFDILNKIGEGSFGTVFKVKSKEDNNFYAVKIFKEPFRNRGHRASLLEEVRRHKQLSEHPNIVTLYQSWEDEGYLYVLLELCENSLEQYTQIHHNISENMVWDILLDIVSAVKYIHEHNLIHMDIKLENILLSSDGSFKLSDFGLVIDATRHTGNKEALEGDPKYLAPEVMNGIFTQAADVFSLGIAILEVAGDLVLPGRGEAWHFLRQGKIPHQQTAKLSTELIELITKMMHPDFNVRITAKEILKSPTLQKKLKLCKLKKFFSNMKHFCKKVYRYSFYPFRKLLYFLRMLIIAFFCKSKITSNNKNNRSLDFQDHSPYRDRLPLNASYRGIGHSTPICNDSNDFLNSNFMCTPASSIQSRQRKNVIIRKQLFAKRKLSYNISDSD